MQAADSAAGPHGACHSAHCTFLMGLPSAHPKHQSDVAAELASYGGHVVGHVPHLHWLVVASEQGVQAVQAAYPGVTVVGALLA